VSDSATFEARRLRKDKKRKRISDTDIKILYSVRVSEEERIEENPGSSERKELEYLSNDGYCLVLVLVLGRD